jgi:hypothetical protein
MNESSASTGEISRKVVDEEKRCKRKRLALLAGDVKVRGDRKERASGLGVAGCKTMRSGWRAMRCYRVN